MYKRRLIFVAQVMAKHPLVAQCRLSIKAAGLHSVRHTKVSRTPLDKWSSCHRHLYLTMYNTHNREIFMPPVGFKPTITASERQKTHVLYRSHRNQLWSL
jgi:hypothetical protein